MKKIVAWFVALLFVVTTVVSALPVMAQESVLTLDKSEYFEGEDILVTATGSGKDWVGLYLRGDTYDPNQGGVTSILWYYVADEGNVSGQTKNIRDAERKNANREDYYDIPAGAYTMALFANDGYTVLASVDFDVKVKPVEPTEDMPILTDKSKYEEGEPILVNALGKDHDWVGLYLKDEVAGPDSVNSILWYYVAADGNASGTPKNIREAEYSNQDRAAYFTIPAGEYKVILLANDGYEVLGEASFTVVKKPEVVVAPPSGALFVSASAGVGRADGSLKIMLSADVTSKPDGFVAYWADKDGRMEEYTELALIPCTGLVTEYRLPDHTLVPVGATSIQVYARMGDQLSKECVVAKLPSRLGEYELGAVLHEFQVMSDIHINVSDTHLHNQHFKAALADITSLSPQSMGIFINGDIADHGQRAEYEAFNQLKQSFGEKLPHVYCAIGNHDLSSGGTAAAMIKTFLQQTGNDSETVYFDRWISGYHFIFLGSEASGLHADLSNAQLTWLRKTLEENRDEGRPIFIFLHQGLMDTVAGTFEYQNWHGVNQSAALRRILTEYPEAVLFSGHSHWELVSPVSMKAADDTLPTIFNTASCAYLWSDDCMATNVGIEGSQGYYFYLYEDRIVARGRDFVNGLWIGSAQFVIDLKSAPTPGTEETTACTQHEMQESRETYEDGSTLVTRTCRLCGYTETEIIEAHETTPSDVTQTVTDAVTTPTTTDQPATGDTSTETTASGNESGCASSALGGCSVLMMLVAAYLGIQKAKKKDPTA